jgi:flagellar biosynthesis/type III secretory pathway protein FliH
MARIPVLECFDPSQDSAATERNRVPSPIWEEGHAQGLADGRALAEAEQAALSAEVAQALADMAFGYAEARATILHGLRPLFAALISRALPGISDTAHGLHVIRMLDEAVEKDSTTPAELSVHPDHVPALTSLLPYAVGMPVMLVADPGVRRDQAFLRNGRAETALDVGAMIAATQAALGAIFDNTDERVNYG